MARPPHLRGTFNYKSIDPRIKKVLRDRSKLDNTRQVAMPFVKATSTLDLNRVESINSSGIGFTIGAPVIQRDIQLQDIFSNGAGSSLVGYTYSGGRTKFIYTDSLTEDSTVRNILTVRSKTVSSNNGVNFIPPPGITGVKVTSLRDGRVDQGTIQIAVPSIRQLEMLHKTFLVPGVGMILEWGNIFADSYDGEQYSQLNTINTFPWHNEAGTRLLLNRLGREQAGKEFILNSFVYDNNGQYEWLYGKVANFSVNANSDGSYECSVKIVGPAENSWAYSTRNTFVPAKNTTSEIENILTPGSVETYFNSPEEEYSVISFRKLLTGVAALNVGGRSLGDPLNSLSEWKGHVVFFKKGNTTFDGESRDSDSETSNVADDTFADSEDAYFMSWRFFVNVVLNDPVFGLKGYLRRIGVPVDRLDKFKTIRPYSNTNGDQLATYLADPYENFVGNNVYLRSTDLSTLVIVNDKAFDLQVAAPDAQRAGYLDKFNSALGRTPSDDNSGGGLFAIGSSSEIFKASEQDLLSKGSFLESAQTAIENATSDISPKSIDRGFLSTGVWINHKAVIQAMASSGTILEGISNLLNRMNRATMNYWNLAIDVLEPEVGDPQNTSIDYIVVDTNFKENSDIITRQFLGLDGEGGNGVHVFNKYISDNNGDGNFEGSDVIDCNVTLNLPQTLFSQIATLGPSTTPPGISNTNADSSIDGELGLLDVRVPDPNDMLRQIFSITSIAAGDDGISPDLTSIKGADLSDVLRNTVQGRAITGAANRNETEAQYYLNNAETIDEVERELETLRRNKQITDQKITEGQPLTDIEVNQAGLANTAIPLFEAKLEELKTIEKLESDPKELVNRFNNLKVLLKFYEPYPDWMVASIANSGDGVRSNAYGAAPGSLSISADLTLPGISGIRVGELFWIDRIPIFYRAFGAFQVMNYEHNISIDGWTTNINARFNYLGNSWKDSIYRIISSEG